MCLNICTIYVYFKYFTIHIGYGEKQCAAAFWNGELEDELREIGSLNFFGLMKKDSDREKVMEEIDKYRAKSVYRHSPEDCSDDCKARGKTERSLSCKVLVLFGSRCFVRRSQYQ